MSGRRSRDRRSRRARHRAGAAGRGLRRDARAVVRCCRWPLRGDVVMPVMGRDLCLEVKARADGFRELYSWLDGRDVLIVKPDRQEPLVVVRLSLAAEIAKTGAE
jgi:hypothetical protein